MNTRVVTHDVWSSELSETKQILSLRKIALRTGNRRRLLGD